MYEFTQRIYSLRNSNTFICLYIKQVESNIITLIINEYSIKDSSNLFQTLQVIALRKDKTNHNFNLLQLSRINILKKGQTIILKSSNSNKNINIYLVRLKKSFLMIPDHHLSTIPLQLLNFSSIPTIMLLLHHRVKQIGGLTKSLLYITHLTIITNVRWKGKKSLIDCTMKQAQNNKWEYSENNSNNTDKSSNARSILL